MSNFENYHMNGRIENGNEPHLPCAVLVDTSGSMIPVVDELYSGLEMLGETLKEDPLALGRVEFCIIGFNSTAQVLKPFGPAYDYEAPRPKCSGLTAMHAAVELAMNEIERRKEEYRQRETQYYRPWIFLLTDGYSNDDDNGAFERLREAQQGDHCTFYSVGIGEKVDYKLLQYLNIKGLTLKASKDNFKECFVWLSNSVSKLSTSKRDEVVALPAPENHQMSVLTAKA